MLRHETYLLRIWHSRAVSGWQWVARLQHLPDGQSLRFRDPEALLAHLQTVVQAGDPPDAAPERPGNGPP